jgi:hypothetical protein
VELEIQVTKEIQKIGAAPDSPNLYTATIPHLVSGIFHKIRMPVQSKHAISETYTPHRIGEVCRLSFQAKSSGAGLGAWEISPAT